MAYTFHNGPRSAYAREALKTITAATPLTAATYLVANGAGAEHGRTDYAAPEQVFITVETAKIRWAIDGSTPTVTTTTSIGHIAGDGDVILLEGRQNIERFKAINEVASNGAALQVTYLR